MEPQVLSAVMLTAMVLAMAAILLPAGQGDAAEFQLPRFHLVCVDEEGTSTPAPTGGACEFVLPARDTITIAHDGIRGEPEAFRWNACGLEGEALGEVEIWVGGCSTLRVETLKNAAAGSIMIS